MGKDTNNKNKCRELFYIIFTTNCRPNYSWDVVKISMGCDPEDFIFQIQAWLFPWDK